MFSFQDHSLCLCHMGAINRQRKIETKFGIRCVCQIGGTEVSLTKHYYVHKYICNDWIII